MKNIYKCCLIITINLIISINLNSQPYKSIFGKENTQWNIFGEDIGFWTHTFTICCDTIISNKNYKKIVLVEDNPKCLFRYKCLYISEDTLKGKLWLYDSEKNKEYLSMDLNLNVGDTFHLNPRAFDEYSDTIMTTTVDSVYYETNLKKIRLNYENEKPANIEKLTFIEGIGPNFGVFFQAETYFSYNPPRQLLCVIKDGIYVYKNKIKEAYDTCYYDIGDNISERQHNKLINLFPIPFQNELNINFLSKFEGYITINNVLGKEEYRKYLTNSIFYKIDLSTLKKGIYFIHIFNLTDNISSIDKIIKY